MRSIGSRVLTVLCLALSVCLSASGMTRVPDGPKHPAPAACEVKAIHDIQALASPALTATCERTVKSVSATIRTMSPAPNVVVPITNLWQLITLDRDVESQRANPHNPGFNIGSTPTAHGSGSIAKIPDRIDAHILE